MKETSPNIFSFATSELSQDAMVCWLIKWASPEFAAIDPALHRTGERFVRLLAGKTPDFKIDFVDVGRQWENIDIWAEINDNTFLVIEDKTGTTIHDNQLERYRAAAEREYKGKRTDLCFAYVKTGNEPLSVLKRIEKKGYRTIGRKDILDCLTEYDGDNYLLLSYISHLQICENATESYKTLPEKKWGWEAWQGFYMELEKELGLSSWEYVANPSGGFLGAWWHFVDVDDVSMYLQFEQGKLCFKISYEGEENSSVIRNKFHAGLMALAKDKFPEIHRPARFGAGTYMTIAVVDEEAVFGEETVDVAAVIRKLRGYEMLLDSLRERSFRTEESNLQ